jgi:hypothetical protein
MCANKACNEVRAHLVPSGAELQSNYEGFSAGLHKGLNVSIAQILAKRRSRWFLRRCLGKFGELDDLRAVLSQLRLSHRLTSVLVKIRSSTSSTSSTSSKSSTSSTSSRKSARHETINYRAFTAHLADFIIVM